MIIASLVELPYGQIMRGDITDSRGDMQYNVPHVVLEEVTKQEWVDFSLSTGGTQRGLDDAEIVFRRHNATPRFYRISVD